MGLKFAGIMAEGRSLAPLRDSTSVLAAMVTTGRIGRLQRFV